MTYISDEVEEYMKDREYSGKLYTNAIKDRNTIDAINSQYESIIKAKDQYTMRMIFEKNTLLFHIIWDADMLYTQKYPKEDPNTEFNGKEYTEYLIESRRVADCLMKNGVI